MSAYGPWGMVDQQLDDADDGAGLVSDAAGNEFHYIWGIRLKRK